MTNGTTVKISNNAAASERTRLVDGDDEDGSTPTSNEGILSRLAGFLSAFYRDNEFVVQIVSAILLAKAYPPIGAVYLKPELSSEWIAVVLMFGKRIDSFRKLFVKRQSLLTFVDDSACGYGLGN